jgi:hypothetical protein
MNMGLMLALLLGAGGGREVRQLVRGLEELIAANAPNPVPAIELQHLVRRELWEDRREGSQDQLATLLMLASQTAGQATATPSTTTTPAATTTGIDPTFLIAAMLLTRPGW